MRLKAFRQFVFERARLWTRSAAFAQGNVSSFFLFTDPNHSQILKKINDAHSKSFYWKKQEKNADFLVIPPHKFSEEHLYFKEDGYQGFSDFTVLSSEYTEGGSTPRAVAIHLTYVNEDEENQIWIRHFTSTSNDSIANVQGKFAEAAAKAIQFCDNYPLQNAATLELKEFYDDGKYPGLGTVKKISIKNHLLIVTGYLR